MNGNPPPPLAVCDEYERPFKEETLISVTPRVFHSFVVVFVVVIGHIKQACKNKINTGSVDIVSTFSYFF